MASTGEVPAWADELTSIVRLHNMKGTLTQGWEVMQDRLIQLRLASQQRVVGEFIRFRVPA